MHGRCMIVIIRLVFYLDEQLNTYIGLKVTANEVAMFICRIPDSEEVQHYLFNMNSRHWSYVITIR